MFDRINLLDDMGSRMRDQALKMAEKIRQGTGADADSREAVETVKRSNEMLDTWDAAIKGLR